MYDKELIQKVCNLTCTKEEVDRNQTTIKYDTEHPFKTYYNVSAITGAIKKYLSKEWDERTLAGWACIYCWILLGGSDLKSIKEDLNSLEGFLRDTITWDLDGMSFVYGDTEMREMLGHIRLFEDYDHIWKTREQWRAVCAKVGPFAEENDDGYVALINDTTKEYMIIYRDYLKNGFKDEHFKFVSQKKFVSLIERLKNSGYKILSCSEEFYYMDVNMDDSD